MGYFTSQQGMYTHPGKESVNKHHSGQKMASEAQQNFSGGIPQLLCADTHTLVDLTTQNLMATALAYDGAS